MRCVDAAIPLDPFAMWPAFPTSDYYGSSVPSRRHQPATGLPAGQLAAGRRGAARMVPTFTFEPLDGVGAQLCPCSIAITTPQAFVMASRPTTLISQGVLDAIRRCALQSSPYPSDWSWRFD